MNNLFWYYGTNLTCIITSIAYANILNFQIVAVRMGTCYYIDNSLWRHQTNPLITCHFHIAGRQYCYSMLPGQYILTRLIWKLENCMFEWNSNPWNAISKSFFFQNYWPNNYISSQNLYRFTTVWLTSLRPFQRHYFNFVIFLTFSVSREFQVYFIIYK